MLGQSTLSIHSVALKYQSEVTMESLNNIRFADESGDDNSNHEAVSDDGEERRTSSYDDDALSEEERGIESKGGGYL